MLNKKNNNTLWKNGIGVTTLKYLKISMVVLARFPYNSASYSLKILDRLLWMMVA